MFITFYQRNAQKQLDFNDFFRNYEAYQAREHREELKYPRAVTVFNETWNYPQDKINQMEAKLWAFHQTHKIETLASAPKSPMYESFYIPKRSGGQRRIDAPKPELMELLKEMKILFEKSFNVIAHNAAFAYVKNRSTLSALQRHQSEGARWFLKLDIQDFFPSCTKRVIMDQLYKLYPFKCFSNVAITVLEQCIDCCLLDGKLPQGTPMSPLLTNLIFIPLDYAIEQKLHTFPTKLIYTRYADDLLISSPYTFDWGQIQTEIQELLSPFILKTQKTRYGSSAGRNWNLGLMYNKDQKITIGHKKKERTKAVLNNFFADLTNGRTWSKIELQILLGQLSYYKQVEPDFVQDLIRKYEGKYGINFNRTCKQILK